MKKEKIEFKWRKHRKCKSEKCRKGFEYNYHETLCGGSGIKKDYCPSCVELWKKTFLNILSRTQRRPYVWPPGKMIEVAELLKRRRWE